MKINCFLSLLFFLPLACLTCCSAGVTDHARTEKSSLRHQTSRQKKAVKECRTTSELYKLHKNLFDGSAGAGDLIVMEHEADEMLKLAAFRSPSPDIQPDRPWKNERDTLAYLIPFFERRQLPAANMTEKYYSILLDMLPDGLERTERELDFLHLLARWNRIAPADLHGKISLLPEGRGLSPEDKVRILFACAMFESVQRRSKDDPEGFCKPYDPHYADIDRFMLERAICIQRQIVASVKSAPKQLCDAWLVLLKLLTFTGDSVRFGQAVAELEKNLPDRKSQYRCTIAACRTILAYAQNDLQTAFDMGKTVKMEQIRRDREFQACFMNSYLQTLCSLQKYADAYALKDRFLRIVVPGKFPRQREIYCRLFDSFKH